MRNDYRYPTILQTTIDTQQVKIQKDRQRTAKLGTIEASTAAAALTSMGLGPQLLPKRPLPLNSRIRVR